MAWAVTTRPGLIFVLDVDETQPAVVRRSEAPVGDPTATLLRSPKPQTHNFAALDRCLRHLSVGICARELKRGLAHARSE